MKNWRQALCKDDLIHLMESGVHDFESLKRNMEGQAEMRKLTPKIEPCWQCRGIANQLGMKI